MWNQCFFILVHSQCPLHAAFLSSPLLVSIRGVDTRAVLATWRHGRKWEERLLATNVFLLSQVFEKQNPALLLAAWQDL